MAFLNSHDSVRISPTALYTGEVWVRHGRSFPELSSPLGAVAYNALQPAMMSSRWLGGPSLQDFLLARHDLIDEHVHSRIQEEGVCHVIEIAAGLSPRGMRFTKQYGSSLRYIEADLPRMASYKRKHIRSHLCAHPNHEVLGIDAFATEGPESLPQLFASLPAGEPVCVITEGLLNYFSAEQLQLLFKILAGSLCARPGSTYVSDIHLQANNQGFLAEAFKSLLGFFVQGRVHLHYANNLALQMALAKAGLSCRVFKPSEQASRLKSCQAKWADLVNIVVAEPHPKSGELPVIDD